MRSNADASTRAPRALAILLAGCLLAPALSSAAPAKHAAAPATPPAVVNSIWISAGGQIAIESYKSFLKLDVGYGRWMLGRLWLDLGLTVLAHADTNAALIGGVRWLFGEAPGFRPFVRAHLELALIRNVVGTSGYAVAITPRGGGGIGYYSSPGFGMTLEANTGLGVSFGQGVRLAAAVDILLGVDIGF